MKYGPIGGAPRFLFLEKLEIFLTVAYVIEGIVTCLLAGLPIGSGAFVPVTTCFTDYNAHYSVRYANAQHLANFRALWMCAGVAGISIITSLLVMWQLHRRGACVSEVLFTGRGITRALLYFILGLQFGAEVHCVFAIAFLAFGFTAASACWIWIGNIISVILGFGAWGILFSSFAAMSGPAQVGTFIVAQVFVSALLFVISVIVQAAPFASQSIAISCMEAIFLIETITIQAFGFASLIDQAPRFATSLCQPFAPP